jgi:hypothetical protein
LRITGLERLDYVLCDSVFDASAAQCYRGILTKIDSGLARKLVTLCALGGALLACAKDISKSPVSEALSPEVTVAKAAALPPDPTSAKGAVAPADSVAANRATASTDSGAAKWTISLLDSAVARPVLDSVTGPHMEWADSLDAFDVASIAASGGTVSRSHEELRIRLLNGRTLTLKTDSTMRMILRYAGYLKGIHTHVVHHVPNEDAGNYLLVDDSTGDSTTVWAMPVPSPDGTRFVLTSLDTDAESEVGNIAVWRMVGRVPDKEFSINGERWESSNAVWRDSHTIDFLKNISPDPERPFTYVKTPARLIRTVPTQILPDSKNR